MDKPKHQRYIRRASAIILIASILLLYWRCVPTLKLGVNCVTGFNYQIYKYFSDLYFLGLNPYEAKELQTYSLATEFKRPAYLDFSGAQLAVYVLCNYISRNTRYNGFLICNYVLLVVIVCVVWRLTSMGEVLIKEQIYFTCLFSVAPAFFQRVCYPEYQDKAVFLLAPLLVWYFWHISVYLAFFTCGLMAGWLGTPLTLLPILAIQATRVLRNSTSGNGLSNQLVRALSMNFLAAILGFGIALAPFFPDALLGWKRRFIVEGQGLSWFSIWYCLGGMHFQGLNGLTVGLLSLAVALGQLMGRLQFKTAIILESSFCFVFALTGVPQRLIPQLVLMVLMFQSPVLRGVYFGLAFVYLCLEGGYFNQYPSKETVMLESAVFNLPVVLGYFLALWDIRKTRQQPLAECR